MTNPIDSHAEAMATETGSTPINVVQRLTEELSASLHSSIAQRDLAVSQHKRFVAVAQHQADRIAALHTQIEDAEARMADAEAAAEQAARVADSVTQAIGHLTDSLHHLGAKA